MTPNSAGAGGTRPKLILRACRIACQTAGLRATLTRRPRWAVEAAWKLFCSLSPYLNWGEITVRTFLALLAVSIVGTIVFWNFGLAHRIWPADPMLATTLIVGCAAIALQLVLSNHFGSEPNKAIPHRQTIRVLNRLSNRAAVMRN